MEKILNNAKLSLYHLPRRRGWARCLGFRRWGGILANSAETLMSKPRTRCWRGKKKNENDGLRVCSPSYTFFYIRIVRTRYWKLEKKKKKTCHLFGTTTRCICAKVYYIFWYQTYMFNFKNILKLWTVFGGFTEIIQSVTTTLSYGFLHLWINFFLQSWQSPYIRVLHFYFFS